MTSTDDSALLQLPIISDAEGTCLIDVFTCEMLRELLLSCERDLLLRSQLAPPTGTLAQQRVTIRRNQSRFSVSFLLFDG